MGKEGEKKNNWKKKQTVSLWEKPTNLRVTQAKELVVVLYNSRGISVHAFEFS